jgi:hypothetical protein
MDSVAKAKLQDLVFDGVAKNQTLIAGLASQTRAM